MLKNYAKKTHFFCTRDTIEVQSGNNEKKNRENNEHLVPRPFTSNNNEQIDKPQKLEDKLESKMER
jgi:hypothetical protein